MDKLYPSFNKNRREMQRRIDAALAEMARDGFIKRVYLELLDLEFSDVVQQPD